MLTMKGCFKAFLILYLSTACVLCTNEIPNSVLKKIGSVGSTREFFDTFVEGGYKGSSGHKVGLDGSGSKVVLTESPGKCQPLETTVDVPPASDPSWFTFPQCVKIKRCAGCCLPATTSCQPNRTALRTYSITHFEYNSASGKMDPVREQLFNLEEHLECACQCNSKASDCTENHIYDENSCRCVCKNSHEIQDCHSKNGKVWDSEKCQCLCKQTKDCPHEYFFNPILCRCQYIPRK